METWMKGIPGSNDWLSIEPIDKGWSADKKYKITTLNHTLLLRVFQQNLLEKKQQEFEFIQAVYQQEITCSEPLSFGEISDNDEFGYMLLSYIEGEGLDDNLSTLSLQQQYEIGIAAGKILRKIHELPLPQSIDMEAQLQELRDKKIHQLQRFKDGNYTLKNQGKVIGYVEQNLDKILTQKVVAQHGDYHPGNIIMHPDGTIGIIDFNRWSYGDPYEEFLKIALYTVESSKAFSLGQIDGYFDEEIPAEFWKMMKIHALHNSVFSIVWAEGFTQQDVDGMVERYYRIYNDYDQSKNNIPIWVEEISDKIKRKNSANN